MPGHGRVLVHRTAFEVLTVATLVAYSTSAAEPERVEDPIGFRTVGVAIASGLGSAYDLVGFHVELSLPKAALFVGTGLPVLARGTKPGDAHYDLAAGLRFFFAPREGIFFSVQTMWSAAGDQRTDDRLQPFGGRSHLKSIGATVGRRWRWDHVFSEIGAGVMLLQGPVNCEGCGIYAPLPDLSVAVGYQF